MATNAVLHHNTPVLTAQGLFHDLDIYPDHLVIHRTDLVSRLFGGEEVISIQRQRKFTLIAGYISFAQNLTPPAPLYLRDGVRIWGKGVRFLIHQ